MRIPRGLKITAQLEGWYFVKPVVNAVWVIFVDLNILQNIH